jgi:chromosome segregation ATPase
VETRRLGHRGLTMSDGFVSDGLDGSDAVSLTRQTTEGYNGNGIAFAPAAEVRSSMTTLKGQDPVLLAVIAESEEIRSRLDEELSRGVELRAALRGQRAAAEMLAARLRTTQEAVAMAEVSAHQASADAAHHQVEARTAQARFEGALENIRALAQQLREQADPANTPPVAADPLSDIAVLTTGALARTGIAVARESELVAQLQLLSDALAKAGRRVSMLEQRRAEGGVHLRNLEALIRKGEEQIGGLSSQLGSANQRVVELERACAEGGVHLRGLEGALHEKDGAIASLMSGINERDQRIAALEAQLYPGSGDAAVTPVDEELAYLRAYRVASENNLTEFESLLNAAVQRCEALEAARLSDAERVCVLEAEVGLLNRLRATDEHRLADSATQLEQLQQQLDAGGAHVRGLEAELARLNGSR